MTQTPTPDRTEWRYDPHKEWHTDEEMLARARAGKVTFDGEEFVGAGPIDATVCVAATGPADDPQSMADAALIVALRNRAPAMVAAIRAAYAQHVPLINSPGRPLACPECLGGIYADDPDEARSCGCWGLVTPICSSCADHHNEKRYPIPWPCATVAALDKALGASGE